MNNFIKKLFGKNEPKPVAVENKDTVEELTPKEIATKNKEPWVGVVNTHVDKTNPRNGFFELDWNEYFILQLRNAGYDGKTDEELVDQWFVTLYRDAAEAEGISVTGRGAGYVNRALRDDGKTEIG